MIQLTKQPIPTGAPVYESSAVEDGEVFVWVNDHSQLSVGSKAVLETSTGALELTTVAAIVGRVTAPGTYVSSRDLARIPADERDHPTLRLYNRKDSLRKLRSPDGALLGLATVFALAAAAVSLVLAFGAANAPTTVADRASDLLTWVAGNHGGRSSAVQATECLSQIRGHSTGSVTIPGVDCTPATASWWQNQQLGTVAIAALGFVAAVLAGVDLWRKIGFGKSPQA